MIIAGGLGSFEPRKPQLEKLELFEDNGIEFLNFRYVGEDGKLKTARFAGFEDQKEITYFTIRIKDLVSLISIIPFGMGVTPELIVLVFKYYLQIYNYL